MRCRAEHDVLLSRAEGVRCRGERRTLPEGRPLPRRDRQRRAVARAQVLAVGGLQSLGEDVVLRHGCGQRLRGRGRGELDIGVVELVAVDVAHGAVKLGHGAPVR